MKTAPVFSSNMVLQRGKNVRIFGQCDADENIRVSIPELQIGTEALVSNGSWTAVLPPMEAHSSVTVEVSSESGSIIFTNGIHCNILGAVIALKTSAASICVGFIDCAS